jgi:hypothetical protein
MKKTYHGSCHCGAITYQASLDLAAGTGRCNCSYCTKTRSWSASVAPQDFKRVTGDEAIGDYGRDWGEGNIHHVFCTRCGTQVYGFGHIPEMGGDFVGIQVNTLDGVDNDELLSGTLRYSDGRNDNWMQAPDDIRTL